MPEHQPTIDFGPPDHALLFAWLARAVLRRAGEERGEALIRRAVARYGEQRGRRMALRARMAGEPLTMAAFLAYGELIWPDDAGEFDEAVRGPDLVERVSRCLWHGAWVENDLLPYGRFYCLEVDAALVRGFNPGLRLDVNGTLSNGAPCCEFVFHQARPAQAEGGIAAAPAACRLPWEYHLGHLFSTVGDLVVHELGAEGQAAMDEALAAFAARYGLQAALQVAAYRDADFSVP